MAIRASDYPETWKQIRASILDRSTNTDGHEQCECRGECGKHDGRCEEINHSWPEYRRRKRKAKVRLTIAHLCHNTRCDDKAHLRAMCEPCHLIYDMRCRQNRLRESETVKWPCGKTTFVAERQIPETKPTEAKVRKRRGRKRTVSDEERAIIYRLSDEGLKAPEIASRLGLPTQVVAGIIAWYKNRDSWGR